MIQNRSMADYLQRALYGLGDIGTTMGQVDKEKSDLATAAANRTATDANTANTQEDTANKKVSGQTAALSLAKMIQEKQLMASLDQGLQDQGQIDKLGPQDPLNGASGPLPAGQDRSPGVLSDQGMGPQKQIHQNNDSLMATLARHNGDPLATPEMMAAKHQAELTKTQNEATRSNQAVTAGQQDINFNQEMNPKRIAGTDLINSKNAQDMTQTNQLFPSKLADSRLQPAKTQAEIDKLDADTEKAAKEAKIGKLPNKEQFDAAGFGRRMDQADSVFGKLVGAGYKRGSVSAGLGSMLPNTLMSSQSQQQDQAERNFVNATLRRESGAAISTGEFTNAEKQYFPRAGDSNEVLAQKAANRAQVRENMHAASGPAWDAVTAVGTGTPATGAKFDHLSDSALDAELRSRGIDPATGKPLKGGASGSF